MSQELSQAFTASQASQSSSTSSCTLPYLGNSQSSVEETPIPPPPSEPTPPDKNMLTRLVNFPYYHFDCDLFQSYTGKIFNVPLQLEAIYEGLNLSRVASVIQTCELPSSSIKALLRYFCVQSLPMVNLRSSCLLCSHLLHLFEQLNLDQQALLSQLATAILPQISYTDACHALIDVWTDQKVHRTTSDLFIHLMVDKVRQKEAMEEFASIATSRYEECLMELCMFVSSREEVTTFEGPVKYGQTQLWNEPVRIVHLTPLITFQSLLKNSNDFVFQIGSSIDNIAIRTSLVHMIPQWSWIRRWFKKSQDPSKSRIASLPVSPNTALAILECLHCQLQTNLTLEEASGLLEHSDELGLVNPADGSAIAPFRPLIDAARKLLPQNLSTESKALPIRRYALPRSNSEPPLKSTLKRVESVQTLGDACASTQSGEFVWSGIDLELLLLHTKRALTSPPRSVGPATVRDSPMAEEKDLYWALYTRSREIDWDEDDVLQIVSACIDNPRPDRNLSHSKVSSALFAFYYAFHGLRAILKAGASVSSSSSSSISSSPFASIGSQVAIGNSFSKVNLLLDFFKRCAYHALCRIGLSERQVSKCLGYDRIDSSQGVGIELPLMSADEMRHDGWAKLEKIEKKRPRKNMFDRLMTIDLDEEEPLIAVKRVKRMKLAESDAPSQNSQTTAFGDSVE